MKKVPGGGFVGNTRIGGLRTARAQSSRSRGCSWRQLRGNCSPADRITEAPDFFTAQLGNTASIGATGLRFKVVNFDDSEQLKRC